MPKAGVVGGIFGLLLVGAIVYFSLGFNQLTCEVCMDFQGRTQCRKPRERTSTQPYRRPKTMPVPTCAKQNRGIPV